VPEEEYTFTVEGEDIPDGIDWRWYLNGKRVPDFDQMQERGAIAEPGNWRLRVDAVTEKGSVWASAESRITISGAVADAGPSTAARDDAARDAAIQRLLSYSGEYSGSMQAPGFDCEPVGVSVGPRDNGLGRVRFSVHCKRLAVRLDSYGVEGSLYRNYHLVTFGADLDPATGRVSNSIAGSVNIDGMEPRDIEGNVRLDGVIRGDRFDGTLTFNQGKETPSGPPAPCLEPREGCRYPDVAFSGTFVLRR